MPAQFQSSRMSAVMACRDSNPQAVSCFVLANNSLSAAAVRKQQRPVATWYWPAVYDCARPGVHCSCRWSIIRSWRNNSEGQITCDVYVALRPQLATMQAYIPFIVIMMSSVTCNHHLANLWYGDSSLTSQETTKGLWPGFDQR
jgi:hypothetical protein